MSCPVCQGKGTLTWDEAEAIAETTRAANAVSVALHEAKYDQRAAEAILRRPDLPESERERLRQVVRKRANED